MKYEFLKNLYYKDQEPFITEYGKRFNSDCAFHLNININGNEAFFLRIPDIYEMIVKIVKTDSRLYDLYMHLPGVAITQYILKSLRACLVSFENNADKSQGNHLERILQNSFTIFPKSTTLIEPTKRTFNNPTLWNNRKGVQFIAFYDLNFGVRNSFYFIGEILSCIASVN